MGLILAHPAPGRLKLLVLFLSLFPLFAVADDPALEEAYRAHALRTLPRDAARRLFSVPATPAALPAESIGAYGKGCLAGGVALAPDGPGWQVMRPSRGRFYGHPRLVAWIEGFARGFAEDGWPDLLIGDMAQPRGGPMITGHESHQLGLEVDIWFGLAPPGRVLTMQERDGSPGLEMVRPDLLEVDPEQFTALQLEMLSRAALSAEVDRIFVNAAIKRAACRSATGVLHWLRKVRPWPGHTQHFHVALKCTDPGCVARNPIPAGDGCGKALEPWFRKEVRFPKAEPRAPRALRLNDLPRGCRQVLAAPG